MSEHSSPDPFAPTEEERRLIGKLFKRRNPQLFARIDVHAALPMSFAPQTLEAFYNDLGLYSDRDWKRRTVASWILGVAELPDGMRVRVKTRLKQVLSNAMMSDSNLFGERLFATGFRTIGLVWSAIMLYAVYCTIAEPFLSLYLLFIAFFALIPAFFTAVFTFPITMPLLVIHAKRRNNRARVMAVKALVRLNALDATPEILQGVFDRSWEVRELCRLALQRFLPQISDETVAWVPLNMEASLGKLLRGNPDVALGEPILDYLERFGIGSCLSVVESYQRFLAYQSLNPAYRAVYEKGERLLPLLRERQHSITQRESLLRHSVAPEAQPDQLLRPAKDASVTPDEQLLRATQGTE